MYAPLVEQELKTFVDQLGSFTHGFKHVIFLHMLSPTRTLQDLIISVTQGSIYGKIVPMASIEIAI